MKHNLAIRNYYSVECIGPDGNLKWREDIKNTTLNAALADLLAVYFKGGTQKTSWYVGLKGSGSIANADTSASHAGWTEGTAYSAANRPGLTLGSVTGTVTASCDNSGAVASFAMNGAYTVAGAFVASSNVKSSASDLIYGAADFTTPRSGGSGDTINVTVTLTTASA
jgi:hypothetical protein